MALMQSQATDSHPIPRRWRNLLPLTGLTSISSTPSTPWPISGCHPGARAAPGCQGAAGTRPPAHHLTTRALAALLGTSQSAVERIIHHLVPMLADTLRPNAHRHSGPWIIDSTLIPVHDQSITAITKNYRRSINTQIVIGRDSRRIVAVGRCRPGNRNDVVVARHTVAHLLTGAAPSSAMAATVASKRSPHLGATPPAASSETSSGGATAGSGPALNPSSPNSKTGRYCVNADAAATPSTRPPNRGRTLNLKTNNQLRVSS